MTIQLELWHLITLLLAFFGCVGGFGKVLIAQFEKRLGERFKAQDEAREAGSRSLREALSQQRDALAQHILDERKTSAQVISLERDFLTWKAELPVQYVRREDYVRNQTIIEAKLDAVALKIENIQLKGLHS